MTTTPLETAPATCEECGATYQRATSGNGKHRRFCTDRCRKRSHGGECEVCGTRTVPGGPGIPKRCATHAGPPPGPPPEVRERAARLRTAIAERYRAGAPLADIAAELGTTYGTVASYLFDMRAAGIDLPRRLGRPGTRAETDQRRARTAELYRAGVPLSDIARELNVTRGTILYDLTRMRRAGVELPVRNRAVYEWNRARQETPA